MIFTPLCPGGPVSMKKDKLFHLHPVLMMTISIDTLNSSPVKSFKIKRKPRRNGNKARLRERKTAVNIREYL
jgi:hypothetical protein